MIRFVGPIAIAIVAGVMVTGCDAGETAQDVSGFDVKSFKSIYAPKRFCDEVKDAVPTSLSSDSETAYRVVCLKNRQWGRNLLKACKEKPRSVKQQYWAYNPGSEDAGYVTCDYLERFGYL